jgi:diguanylate cyclase (GGDEF)-like protein
MPLFADSAIWVAVGLAIGAAVLALGLSAAMILYLTRLRRAPSTELDVVKASVSRTETMVAELTGALELARTESRQSRRLAEIASTIDIDAVLERTLSAAAELPGVDAAMLALPDDKEPLVATVGMTAEEAARQPVSRPPGGTARAIRVDYRYARAQEEEADPMLIRGGIAVPLRDAENEPIGTLAVFWRGSARAATDEELAQLEELAASCGPAIENAQRFREARQLADLDALTNLHNRRYFHETLAREHARADRYERRLSLVVVDVDDFKAINDRIGHLAGDSVLATVAERLRSVVRSADVACRIGGDEFAVILPEASLTDAEELYQRMQFAVASRPIGSTDRVHISAGIAELRPEDDAVSLFQRADEALYRAKEAGKGQVRAADSSGSQGQL